MIGTLRMRCALRWARLSMAETSPGTKAGLPHLVKTLTTSYLCDRGLGCGSSAMDVVDVCLHRPPQKWACVALRHPRSDHMCLRPPSVILSFLCPKVKSKHLAISLSEECGRRVNGKKTPNVSKGWWDDGCRYRWGGWKQREERVPFALIAPCGPHVPPPCATPIRHPHVPSRYATPTCHTNVQPRCATPMCDTECSRK